LDEISNAEQYCKISVQGISRLKDAYPLC